jgi:drug/metabolite transporter (DMT)-like permease
MQQTQSPQIASGNGAGEASHWLLLTMPGLIWGASYLFIAEGLLSLGPNGVTFTRVLIGFATLSFFPAVRKSVPRSEWLGVALLGVLWMAVPLSLFPYAEQRVSSAITGMLNGANPLLTAIVAAFVARKAPSGRILLGLVVGIAGTVMMALPTNGQGRNDAIGVAMIFAALVCYAFALNIARPLQQRNGALPVIWRAQVVALVLTAPLGLPELAAAHWRLEAALSLLALGALGTGAAFVIMSVAAGKLGATRASGTIFLIPVVALVLGVLVRHEHVGLVPMIGAAACVGGAWFMRHVRASDEARLASSIGLQNAATAAHPSLIVPDAERIAAD